MLALGLARDVATGVITALAVSLLTPSVEECADHLKKKVKARLRPKRKRKRK